MDGQGLRMCRLTRDGIPELGEYLESVDGTGICKLTELDGGGEEVVVWLPDGTMPEGISDLELVRVPFLLLLYNLHYLVSAEQTENT